MIFTIINGVDQARQAALDTTGKTEIEKSFIETITTVTNTPASELLSDLLYKAIHFGLKVLAALLIYILGGLLIKWAKKLLRKMFTRLKTDPAIVSFATSLVTAAMWVLVIIIAVGTLGVETTSLAALLAAGGMAIGMALSGTVQNFAGGIMILAFRPFRVGDFIEAQGFSGTVSEINITSTRLTTPDNRTIVLPNGALSSGTINNFSRMEFRRLEFCVSVEYGSQADMVKESLLEIANSDERVVSAADGAPEDPYAVLKELGASSVDFLLRVWVRTSDYWNVFYDINERIYETLPEKGISFPFNQLVIHNADK